ncbi:hypothetical protein HO173_002304 [Letharia columbiana]|uniref:Uncharacterized protein n=1 Tax=Letharia columbiana TaxID=112416 RepID=A0A8H6G397_9LECA|nr:uncharacterized protein HO173_002304 [Letharia columbiana]KAF6239758.1 hypothetical protein HO173_002304 [Letharia columbiana]
MITRSTGQSTAFFLFPHNYQPSGTGIAPILNKNPRVQIQAHHMRKPRASRLPPRSLGSLPGFFLQRRL